MRRLGISVIKDKTIFINLLYNFIVRGLLHLDDDNNRTTNFKFFL